jgi:hypothetical protein
MTEDKDMIKSMTGFGRCEIQKESRKFTVELKSVNHRYLDVNIRMPKKLNFFETAIRTLLKQYALIYAVWSSFHSRNSRFQVPLVRIL